MYFAQAEDQNGSIHRKLRVPTSEMEGELSNPRTRAPRARCIGKIYGNLWKPTRVRRARAMQIFCAIHKYSKSMYSPQGADNTGNKIYT
jgi:hypothetical protein